VNGSLSRFIEDSARDRGDNLRSGAHVGHVTNTDDTDGLQRVRVTFPSFSSEDESFWARVAVPMAGPNRGMYFPLEVNDEVLVVFGGDLREPYVIGAMWNGKDAAPHTDNDLRMIRSRSGHVITLNDKDGNETVEIIDRTGNNKVVIDTATNSITISADQDITLAAPKGKIAINAKTIEITSSEKSDITVGGDLKINATGNATVSGKIVNIN
jgi:uncharacterized protein involved in type VI secretion and phage assembly